MREFFYFTFLGAFIALSGILSSCNMQTEESSDIAYGPLGQNYKLPEVSGTTYYVSPDGNASADGLNINEPTVIEQAIKRVETGDAIVMRGGIYRTGDLIFNQGITIQAYRDEKPVLNGTLVADSWAEAGDGIWVTDWEKLFPAGPESWWNRRRNEKYTPMHRFNNDVVFVDGQFLNSAGSTDELDEDTYYVDYDANKIYIGTDPTERLVEITAFRKAIFRTLDTVHGKEPDKKGPVIKGITFTQYPDTMVHIGGVGLAIDQHGKDVVGTLFENCSFTYSFRIAMFALSDSLVMRNCKVAHTNTEGVYIVASSDIILERNVFENNNIEKWTGFYPSSVKIFNQSHRAIVRENHVLNHPNSNGVWWDVGNRDGVFANNFVENVDHSGLFFEISDGLTVAGNVFANCDQSIFVLNSSNVEIFNNTFVNSRVNVSRNNRGDELGVFGWHVTTGPGVEERDGHVLVNNLFFLDADCNSTAVSTGQPSSMCERLSKPHFKSFDNNLFVRNFNEGADTVSLIQWSPFPNDDCRIEVFTPAELNEVDASFLVNSEYIENIAAPLFVDMENKNYRLMPDWTGVGSAAPIPANIADLLGVDVDAVPFIGAYGQ
jgi:parallel beta-helix repeat protein